jgi:calcyphosin
LSRAAGIKGIGRIFKAMDDNGNRTLDLDRWGFIDYGFNLSKEEAAEIMKRFDRNNDGVISYDEFLRFLKVRKRA